MMTRSNLHSENIILVAERTAGWRGGKGEGRETRQTVAELGRK